MATRKQQALQDQTSTIERRVFLGIGDAVLRLVHVELMYAMNTDPSAELIAERNLIVQALNQQYQLDLGMDCDMDGIPDAIDPDVSMLTHAAQTSCCRIIPEDGSGSRNAVESRVEPLPDPTPSKKSPSRAAAAKKKRAAKKPADPVPQTTPRKKPATSRKKKTTSRKTSKPAEKTDTKTDTKTAKKPKGFLSSIFGADEENQ
jgi:hypothetical protein